MLYSFSALIGQLSPAISPWQALMLFDRYARGESEFDDSFGDGPSITCEDHPILECTNPDIRLNIPMPRASWIDAAYTDEAVMPKVWGNSVGYIDSEMQFEVRNGVKLGEGDGTVSLLSLGAMCAEGWKRPRWNPAGIKIITVEVKSITVITYHHATFVNQLPHRPNPSIPRGGANTGDHVDILGSTGLNEVILKVATGVGHEVKDNYVSNIKEYSQRIQWD